MQQQKQCPRCKAQQPLQAGVCSCGHQFRTRFGPDGKPIQQASPPPASPQYQPPRAAGKVIQMVPGTHSITWAVILGVLCFPGLGQMFNHQFGKGGAALVISIALVWQQVATYFAHGYTDGVISLVQTALWIGLAVDAGMIAARLKRGDPVQEWQFF